MERSFCVVGRDPSCDQELATSRADWLSVNCEFADRRGEGEGSEGKTN